METKEEAWSAAMRAERRGDSASYEWLLRDIGRLLLPLITSRLRQLGMPTTEADDILQEVLIGLHSMRGRWDQNRQFLPWLHAILRYKLTDSLRRRSREVRFRVELSDLQWGSLLDETDSFEGVLSESGLESALDDLPAGQRKVVKAIALEGASYRETAADLDISEGAIRMIMHRALKKLAKLSGGQR